jgi:hypothetical protein
MAMMLVACPTPTVSMVAPTDAGIMAEKGKGEAAQQHLGGKLTTAQMKKDQKFRTRAQCESIAKAHGCNPSMCAKVVEQRRECEWIFHE